MLPDAFMGGDLSTLQRFFYKIWLLSFSKEAANLSQSVENILGWSAQRCPYDCKWEYKMRNAISCSKI